MAKLDVGGVISPFGWLWRRLMPWILMNFKPSADPVVLFASKLLLLRFTLIIRFLPFFRILALDGVCSGCLTPARCFGTFFFWFCKGFAPSPNCSRCFSPKIQLCRLTFPLKKTKRIPRPCRATITTATATPPQPPTTTKMQETKPSQSLNLL